MTNQRFVWRRSRSLAARSLQICTKPRACDIFCLLPRYGQDLLGWGPAAGSGGQRHKADAALLCTTGVCWPAEPPLLNSARC
jgi:hypothetical protein